ncbi:MAG: DEAD box-related helicase [Bacteroidetes bacterium]|nr:MAG: DEAD box-related helicase [Bacteroidota bacterium]
MSSFYDFGFNDGVLDGIEAMNFDKPTPIQEQTIPLTMSGRDVIGCAQTGTGKTAAYLLPIMHHLLENPNRTGVGALILSPTRELALQIDQAATGFCYFSGLGTRAVYGGGDAVSFENEKKALTKGADIIIATPGRLLAHLNLGYVNFSNLQHLILDEADRMLDMGFFDDIMRIVKGLPENRQTLMFSATMPPRIRQLASKILKNPAQVNIAISKPAEGIVQQAYCTYDTQKIPLLVNLLANDQHVSIIIFSSTKIKVKEIERELKRLKYSAAAIHSDLEQNEREEVLRSFRNRNLRMLVATDVLSRGIDIENISLVINFDVPGDAEDYVHRVGRTARAESTGMAITLINEFDMSRFASIEKLIGYEIPKLPLPGDLGEGPAYNPAAKHFRSFGHGKGGNKGGGNKGGGGGGGKRRFNGRKGKGGSHQGKAPQQPKS